MASKRFIENPTDLYQQQQRQHRVMDKDKGSDKDKGYSVQGDGKDKKNDGDMGKKDSGKGDDNQGEVDEIIVEHWTIPMTTTITTATTTT